MELRHLARLEELLPIAAVAIARPDDAFGDVGAVAVGLDIHQLGGEVGVRSAAAGVQGDGDGARDGHGLGQARSGVDEHVLPLLDLRLVLDSR